MASEAHWKDWFRGMTKALLAINVPKVLILANNELMDHELTVAMMQGKFKLEVVKNVGHLIHEDNPEKVADILNNFIKDFHINEDVTQNFIITAEGKKVYLGQKISE